MNNLHNPHTSLPRILHPLAPTWSGRNRRVACRFSAFWRDWLFDQGSLTARLCTLGDFSVNIVREYHGHPTQLERQQLKLPHHARVWVREVVLSVNQQPLVYARTAVPAATLTGQERRLQHLGQRSLGSYLFRQPRLQRQPLSVCHCNHNALGLEWCRYSVFTLGRKPLMVSEAFAHDLVHFSN